MPYRRLPNTDEARIRSLKRAIERQEIGNIHDLAFSLKTLHEAKVFLLAFERARLNYKQAFQMQVNANKKYQKLVKQAKLYISHFVQVLNLCVIRKEIKPESKRLYGLEPDNFAVPDMVSDTSVLEWGEKIIEGEQNRLSKGGAPIYNPTIAKVRVHYDLFKDAYREQKVHQQNTSRTLEVLSGLRQQGDTIIVDIWNQVEEVFQGREPEERLEKCKAYGIIYYYRRGEKRYVTEPVG
jgi:hypothetical protein